MSQTLVKPETAAARATAHATSNALTRDVPLSSLTLSDAHGYPGWNATRKSHALSNLLAHLRDHFVFDDFLSIQGWVATHPYYFDSLFSASRAADTVFGRGRAKWLSIIPDWKGSETLSLEIEFAGTGEESSRLCREFIESWQAHQNPDFRRILDIGVRFV